MSSLQFFNRLFIACLSVLLGFSSVASGFQTTEQPVRVAAEWEPAIGVLIAWPFVVPEKLVTDIAEKERLFVVLETVEEKPAAIKKFAELKIPDNKVTYVVGDPEEPEEPAADLEDEDSATDEDSVPEIASELTDDQKEFMRRVYVWTRDWGPFAGFDSNGKYHLIDPMFKDYPYTGPACDAKIKYFPNAQTTEWNGDEVRSLGAAIQKKVRTVDAYLTGGNVMFDGIGTAMSTCLTINENRHFGIDRETFEKATAKSFGVSKFHIIPNFEERGIQHIDCLLKFLNEDTILVARPPVDSRIHDTYQEIVARLAQLKNCRGQRYKICRIDCGIVSTSFSQDTVGIAAYTNSLILNKRIFVPLYGIETDKSALETWRLLMPGYEVLGYEFTKKDHPVYAWESYDALHCRTRAIWDPEMLHMSPAPASKDEQGQNGNTVAVKIIDYSQKGLIKDRLTVSWRVCPRSDWQKQNLGSTEDSNIFTATIPAAAGNTFEYYFSAADNSGREETLPRTAPDNVYRWPSPTSQ